MPTKMTYDDGSKRPYTAESYADMRGVVEFGNLMQFAPYETGYSFISVINGPYFMECQAMGSNIGCEGVPDLQKAFIKIIEQEFKGLDGIDDVTTETMEISDNISSIGLLAKSVQTTNNQITMRFTEKSGALLTKYVNTYIRYVRDPKTQVTTYGGIAGSARDGGKRNNDGKEEPRLDKQVFNILYIVTDSSCLNVEKAYLFLNAWPTSAPFSELYNFEKGDVGLKEISITFNNFTVDGQYPNKIAQDFLDEFIDNTMAQGTNKINVNSWANKWIYSDGRGEKKYINNLATSKTKVGLDTL